MEHLSNLYGKWIPVLNHFNKVDSYYSTKDCIEIIRNEIELKKSPQTIKKVDGKSTISASNLADFDFCPASFVINNSFVIDKPSGDSFIQNGLQFHEKLLLIKKSWYKKTGVGLSLENEVVSFIRDCKLILKGHGEEERIFKNGDWVGTPDYIFQDKNNDYFVVEEKFHYSRDPARSYRYISSEDKDRLEEIRKEEEQWQKFKGNFPSNHIVQIVSYIKNIQEYPITYGYLLYWYYDHEDNQPYIHKVVAKKIVLDEPNEALYTNALNGISNIKSTGDLHFQTGKLNMRKCAGCFVNKYCGHKTKRYNRLSYPYQTAFLRLFLLRFQTSSVRPHLNHNLDCAQK